jgi:hypothetical protein
MKMDAVRSKLQNVRSKIFEWNDCENTWCSKLFVWFYVVFWMIAPQDRYPKLLLQIVLRSRRSLSQQAFALTAEPRGINAKLVAPTTHSSPRGQTHFECFGYRRIWVSPLPSNLFYSTIDRMHPYFVPRHLLPSSANYWRYETMISKRRILWCSVRYVDTQHAQTVQYPCTLGTVLFM